MQHTVLKSCRQCLARIHTSATSFGNVELTSKRYPHLRRGRFSQLTSDDVTHFRQLLGPDRVLTEDLDGYNTDWMRSVRGASQLVLRPRSTAEVSAVLRHCSERRLAVCPQGGNTGLVGGSTPVFDEIVLSTSLMNKIIALDTNSGALTCEAGCVLEATDAYLADHGFMMPLDLGAKGSCQIGGNVSTNAGGLRLVRYGGLHGSVLGLEAVMADGQVLDCMSTMKKDNTGYDLKHLLIGSEGTLGVVTKVAISCPRRPNCVNLVLLAVKSFEDVLATYRFAQTQLGEILSSIEFMDAASQECVSNNLKVTHPLPGHPFYMVIETAGSRDTHDEEKLSLFLEEGMQRELVIDGVLATDTSQIKSLWQLRERIAEALLVDGYNYKYDISLPLHAFYDIVTEMRQTLGDSIVTCCGYGHIGDGNLHLNMTSREFDGDVLARIEPSLYRWTAERGGSISAEHGLGLKKRDYIGYSKSPGAVVLMRQLKRMMDPHGILNPHKVLPEES
ncbi:D-2-hydroxyglutarate dehydrogenase, mitochondrial-like [Pollicipes pollicipes]|uniref:D-2-hydroxyglutarate dehydrogenase, mitochondrial-like n=1 Tax=Pollicipes pollicipes TaxID=41117 RepID=UPI0018852E0D|nr:D-2-hydroxyglutarate dehydrogenase, mitochondrial-like [Pollicipes pollicipes]